jgi:nucleotide-binding universal stress UspA family protein
MEYFPTKVLLATDGSEDAALAARAAADISKETGSELHVVHVLPQFPRYAYPGVTPQVYSYVLDQTLREARDLLDEQVKRIKDSDARVAETHVRRGPATDEVLDLAEDLEAGLIVVGDPTVALLEAAEEGAPERTLIALGSRGLDATQRLRLGSISTKVLHAANGPVLVCPPPQS